MLINLLYVLKYKLEAVTAEVFRRTQRLRLIVSYVCYYMTKYSARTTIQPTLIPCALLLEPL